ncbi:DNA-directed RNA polymerase subunit omega [Varanus komodoensis]|nr:DNA-directed RNA polymerase subunit omega [Varanus komodoensis]
MGGAEGKNKGVTPQGARLATRPEVTAGVSKQQLQSPKPIQCCDFANRSWTWGEDLDEEQARAKVKAHPLMNQSVDPDSTLFTMSASTNRPKTWRTSSWASPKEYGKRNLAALDCQVISSLEVLLHLLPFTWPGDPTLLLMASGGAVGGLLFFGLLGTVVYKMTVNRKKKRRQEEEDDIDDPSLCVTDGAMKQETTPKPEKPHKSKKETFNMYSKTETEMRMAADNDLSSETYEAMGVVEDYKTLSTEASAGLYGNLGNWQASSGPEQIYSNV